MRGEGVRGEGAGLECEQPRREDGVEEAAAHDRASHAVVLECDAPLAPFRAALHFLGEEQPVCGEDAKQEEGEGEAQEEGDRAVMPAQGWG